MKGSGNMFWNILAFSLVLSWVNVCLADPETLKSPKPTESNSVTPSNKLDSSFLESMSQWRLPETIQIHGFASQSYIHTSGNDFFGHSTNMGSLDFTEMGLNGSWRPLSQLQASLQVVYRRAGKTDDSNVRIDFGFLDYSFLSNANSLMGIRLGRVVNPYGLYNDTRDMPFTRPSILLPQSIYFDINRNFALSGDGLQVYGEHRTEYGDFFLQINGFYPRTNDPSLVQKISYPFQGNLGAEPSWVSRLMYEWDAGKIRLGITGGELNAKYQPTPNLISPINWSPGTFSYSALILSAQYNAEAWSLTSEYAIRSTEFNGFNNLYAPHPDAIFNSTGESYYIQGSYRFTDNLEGFVRYDALFWNTSDRNGKKFAAMTGQPAYSRFAKDITTGLRWDITSSIMARVEYHYINGTGWISDLENIPSETSQHWSLVSAALSFRF